jgi:hypothetical protein
MTDYAFTQQQSSATLLGYLTAALWTNELDDHTVPDFDIIDAMRASRMIDTFLNANEADVWNMIADGFNFGQVGHDLWLTRNGHGTGFWDRSPDAPYLRLTDAARNLGESDCYVADDGAVHLT